MKGTAVETKSRSKAKSSELSREKGKKEVYVAQEESIFLERTEVTQR